MGQERQDGERRRDGEGGRGRGDAHGTTVRVGAADRPDGTELVRIDAELVAKSVWLVASVAPLRRDAHGGWAGG